MSFTSKPYPTDPAPISSPGDAHLIRGALIGLLAALVLMPVHSLLISWTYKGGYYTDYPVAIAICAAMVAVAVRLATGSHGPLVAMIAVPVTLVYLIGSEYLAARVLINQSLAEEGYQALPLLVDPQTGIEMLGLYIKHDPAQLIMWLTGLVVAGFLGMQEQLAGGMRYRLSGRAPAGMASPSTAARPAAAPPAPPAKIRAEDIPAEALALGRPIQVYETRVMELALAGGFYLLLAVGCGVGAYLGRDMPGMSVFAGAFGLLFLGLGVYRFIVAVLNLDNQVIIFDGGISVHQKGATAVIHWPDIRAVWQRQYRFRSGLVVLKDEHYYRIERKDGPPVVIDKTYSKIGDLGAAIQVAVTREYLPKAVEVLKAGGTLAFGKFNVRSDAMVVGETAYPWPEVGTVGVWQSNVLMTKKKGIARQTADMSTVPNLHLFFTLVYSLLKGELPSVDATLPEEKGPQLMSPYDRAVTW